MVTEADDGILGGHDNEKSDFICKSVLWSDRRRRKAGAKPEIHEGQIGPAMQFAKELAGIAEVTHTIICGDNYMGSNTEEAVETILGMLEGKEMDLFLAGPAFQAGRYTVACGTICKAVKENSVCR